MHGILTNDASNEGLHLSLSNDTSCISSTNYSKNVDFKPIFHFKILNQSILLNIIIIINMFQTFQISSKHSIINGGYHISDLFRA